LFSFVPILLPPNPTLSCLQIKIISRELQNISGNSVIKIKSVVIFINITLLLLLLLLLLKSPLGARISTAISQMRPSTAVQVFILLELGMITGGRPDTLHLAFSDISACSCHRPSWLNR
jgi:hypothetical protein